MFLKIRSHRYLLDSGFRRNDDGGSRNDEGVIVVYWISAFAGMTDGRAGKCDSKSARIYWQCDVRSPGCPALVAWLGTDSCLQQAGGCLKSVCLDILGSE